MQYSVNNMWAISYLPPPLVLANIGPHTHPKHITGNFPPFTLLIAAVDIVVCNCLPYVCWHFLCYCGKCSWDVFLSLYIVWGCWP